MMTNLPFLVVGIIFIMGLIAVIAENNLIKIAIGIGVMESAVNLFLVAMAYRNGGNIPIKFLAGGEGPYVLPTPQALTLTAIVIALATSALMLSLIVMLYRHYGTLDIREIRRLRG